MNLTPDREGGLGDRDLRADRPDFWWEGDILHAHGAHDVMNDAGVAAAKAVAGGGRGGLRHFGHRISRYESIFRDGGKKPFVIGSGIWSRVLVSPGGQFGMLLDGGR